MRPQKKGTRIINYVQSELMHYSTVEVDGVTVYRTGPFKTREMARQDAQEWEAKNIKKESVT